MLGGGHWVGGRNDYKGFQSSYIAVLASALITKVPCITTWEVRKTTRGFLEVLRGLWELLGPGTQEAVGVRNRRSSMGTKHKF